MPDSIFVERLAELPKLLEAISYFDRAPVAALAREVGRSEADVRGLLRAYALADSADDVLLGVRPSIEFYDADGHECESAQATHVSVDVQGAEEDLALSSLPREVFARFYRLGRDRLHLDPDNELLRAAVFKMGETLEPRLSAGSLTVAPAPSASQIYQAIARHEAVEITYTRAWQPGTSTRTIHPYRLVRTRRNWEVDAGPPDENGRLRTFLLGNIQRLRVTGVLFDLPPDLAELLSRQRRLTEVTLVVPQSKRWVVEHYAEKVGTVSETTSQATVVAQLLAPVRERVALILLTVGPAARVAEGPVDVLGAERELARKLLAHHVGS